MGEGPRGVEVFGSVRAQDSVLDRTASASPSTRLRLLVWRRALPSARDLPMCPPCAEQDTDPQRLKSAPRLTSADLADYDEVIESIGNDGVHHLVDPVGVIGRYDLTEPRHCSYFGTLHKHGLLIEARCGAWLSIGHHCGKRDVPGFESIVREVEAASRLQSLIESQEEGPQQLFESISSLASHARRRFEGRDALRRVRRLHEAMFRAYTTHSYNVEIRVRRFNTRTNQEEPRNETRPLAGLKLFELSENRIAQLLAEAKSYRDEVPSLTIDHDNYEAIAQRRKKLRDAEHMLQRWLDESRKFWTTENLRLVLVKTFGQDRVPDEISVEERTIVVKSPSPIFIGIEGVIPEDATPSGDQERPPMQPRR